MDRRTALVHKEFHVAAVEKARREGFEEGVAREREAARREASGEIEMLRAENARLRALSRGGRL